MTEFLTFLSVVSFYIGIACWFAGGVYFVSALTNKIAFGDEFAIPLLRSVTIAGFGVFFVWLYDAGRLFL